MFERMGLSRRLNIIIIVINVVVLVSIAALATISSDAALRDQAIERFSDKTDEAVNQLNIELQMSLTTAQDLAATLSELESLNERLWLRNAVDGFLRSTDGDILYERINIIRPGDVASTVSIVDVERERFFWRDYTSFDRVESLNMDDPAIQFVLENRVPLWFFQPENSYFGGQSNVISLAVPYSHPEGDFILWVDILRSRLDARLTEILNNEGLLSETQRGYTLLVDGEGNILSANNLPVGFEMPQDAVSTLTDRLSGQVGTLQEVADPFYEGEPALYNVSRSQVNDWRLISSLPVAEIPDLPSNVLAPIGLVAVLGLLVLTYLTNQFVASSVVKPLVDLGRSAAEIGEGNMRFVIFHQDKQDEIGRLAKSMEQMRVRLKESYDELQQWSRTLEQRVDERTLQLQQAQEEAEVNAEQLRAVYDESLSVVNESQLQPVLDQFIDRILTLLDASYCAVWMLTSDNERLQLLASNDERKRHHENAIVIHRTEGMAGQAVRKQQPIMVNDYRTYSNRTNLDEYYEGEPEAPFVRGLCVPLMFAGKAIGAAIAGRPDDSAPFDIDEQRQLTLFTNLVAPSVRNAQLFLELNEAVEEAERANQVKTRFLASVTHELRTPLNLIINNMDFMSVGTFGEINDEQEKRLKQTIRSAEHLLYLINDLLDVSKIEAGEMQLFIQKSDVNTMLDDTIDNTYALLDSYEDKDDVAFRVEVEDDLPEIPMDTRRIRQVLNNLLSNAIKFTSEGSVTLKVFETDNGVHFSVHDTGLGIPEEEMELLFAAFERTSAAKQANIEGTGLGLPISRYMVRQHGGDLTVISTEGEGSTFAFTLPFNPPDKTRELDMSDTQQINAVLSSRSK